MRDGAASPTMLQAVVVSKVLLTTFPPRKQVFTIEGSSRLHFHRSQDAP